MACLCFYVLMVLLFCCLSACVCCFGAAAGDTHYLAEQLLAGFETLSDLTLKFLSPSLSPTKDNPQDGGGSNSG